MSMEKLDAFLSCSFREEDKAVNRAFAELCAALNIRCSNFDSGSVTIPSEASKKELEGKALLIAVCTRRDERKDGSYNTSGAVRSEIDFAYALKIPVQLFIEEGVELAGFEHQYGTAVTFSRDNLSDLSQVQKIIKTLFRVREETLAGLGVSDGHSDDATKAEFIHSRIFQTLRNEKPYWAYKVHKKTIFAERSQPYVNAGAWLEDYQTTPDDAPPFEFESRVFGSSGVEQIKEIIKRIDERAVSAILQFLPAPQEGDWIEYETSTYSPFLVPMWLSETDPKFEIKLKKGTFRSHTGFIATNDTDLLTVEQRFPRSMNLSPRDVHPFAARFTSEIDDEVPSETKRIVSKSQFIGDELVSKIEIRRPIRHLMYGMAWTPRECPMELSRNPSKQLSKKPAKKPAGKPAKKPAKTPAKQRPRGGSGSVRRSSSSGRTTRR